MTLRTLWPAWLKPADTAPRPATAAQLQTAFATLLSRIDKMTVDLARLSADVQKIVALVPYLQAKIAALSASNNDAAIQPQIDALAASIEAVVPASTHPVA